MKNGDVRHQVRVQSFGERENDREDHGRCTNHRSPNQHGFGRRLERIACPVVLLEEFFGLFELGHKSEIAFDVFVDAANLFDRG